MQLENTFTVPVDIDTVYDAMNDPEKITPCFPGATLTSADGDDFTGTVKVKLGPISLTYKGKGTFVERDRAAHRIVVDAQGRDARGNGTASAKATLTMAEAGGGGTTVTVLTEMQITGKPAQFGRGVMSDVGDKILGQFASCLAEEFADAPAAGSGAASSNGTAAPASSGAGGAAGAATTASQPTTPAPVAAASGAPEPAPMASTVAQARAANADAATPGASPVSAAPRPAAAASVPSAPRPPRKQVEAIDLLEASSGAMTKRLLPVAAAAGVLVVILVVLRIVRR